MSDEEKVLELVIANEQIKENFKHQEIMQKRRETLRRVTNFVKELTDDGERMTWIDCLKRRGRLHTSKQTPSVFAFCRLLQAAVKTSTSKIQKQDDRKRGFMKISEMRDLLEGQQLTFKVCDKEFAGMTPREVLMTMREALSQTYIYCNTTYREATKRKLTQAQHTIQNAATILDWIDLHAMRAGYADILYKNDKNRHIKGEV